ncbi:MAG: hypothetical protein E3K36_12845 [Candidatus Brocadia sp.]|nr:hypothetical protein [Candidatus Brocadia sp.]
MKEAFQYIIKQHPFRIQAFVLLSDHIHCIWTLPENDNAFSMHGDLSRVISADDARVRTNIL